MGIGGSQELLIEVQHASCRCSMISASEKEVIMSRISETAGIVFIIGDGKFAKVVSRLSHVGLVDDVEYVSDINDATVFTQAINSRVLDKINCVAKLRATCVVNRTVTITGELNSESSDG